MIYALLVAVIFALIGLVVFLLLLHKNEKAELMNRIMSVDYREFRMFQEKMPKEEIEPASALTEEEEYLKEENRLKDAMRGRTF